MSRLLPLWIVLLVCVGGCAANRNHFEPVSVNDPGPWPLEKHTSGIYKYWLSSGRYCTSELGVRAASFRAGKEIVQVASYPDVKILFEFTIDDADGHQVLVKSGGKPCDKHLQLGSWKVPLSSDGSTLGVLSRNDQVFADFECRLHGTDLGMLHVGSQTLDIKLRESRRELLDELFSAERNIDFMLDDEPVGTLFLLPDRRIWLKRNLNEDTRVTIVATAVTLSEEWDKMQQQAAASSAAMSSAQLRMMK